LPSSFRWTTWPLIEVGQSAFVEQTVEGAFEQYFVAQVPPMLLHVAPPYWQTPPFAHGWMDEQAVPLTEQVPDCGEQSAFDVQLTPDDEQVPFDFGQSASVRHGSPLWHLPDAQSSSLVQVFDVLRVQVPALSDVRQSVPSSQSMPTSVFDPNAPPGTPVIDPDVSSTTSMFTFWICREIASSGFTFP
jgi:hypothetical protein